MQQVSPTFKNFGIAPQDLMQNESSPIKSEIEVDEIYRNNEIKALAFADVSNTNDPTTIQNQQQAQAALRKKKDELAAAVALVSNLRKEIRTLEVSSLGSPGNLRYTNKHKCAEDESTHQAKRMKEKATAPSFTSSFPQDATFRNYSSYPKDIYLASRNEYASNRSNTFTENQSSSVYCDNRAKSPPTTDPRQSSAQTSHGTDEPTNIVGIWDDNSMQTNRICENRREPFGHSEYALLGVDNRTCGPSVTSFVGKLKQAAIS